MDATVSEGKSGAKSFFTSSLPCGAKKCFDDEGTSSRKQLEFFYTTAYLRFA